MPRTRKIYNKLVLDINGNILEEDSYLYSGPMALCDGEEDNSGEKNSDEDNKSQQDNSTAVVDAITQLGTGMQSMFQGLSNEIKNMSPKEPDPKDVDTDDNDDHNQIDLETLDRRGFMDIMLKSVGGMLDNKLSDVQKSVDGVSRVQQETSIEKQVTLAKEKHKDFDEWIPELKEYLKFNPTVPIADAVVIVKNRSPEKTTKLKEQLDKKDPTKTGYNNMKPNNRKVEPKKNLKPAEAAEQAWAEIFGEDTTDTTNL